MGLDISPTTKADGVQHPAPAMQVIDSQVHIWGPDSPQRPWPSRGGNLRHRYVPADALIQEMDAAGVNRAILVPPVFEGDRNDVVQHAAMRYPDRFGIMGRLSLESPVAAGTIETWRETPGMLGIRQSFHLPEHRQLLLSGRVDWFWSEAEAAGLPLYVFCPGFLELMGDIARRHPALRITINHCALAPDADIRTLHTTVTDLEPLSSLPNVAVMISALPCHVNEPFPFAGLRDPITRIVKAFGPRRIFWGSDLTRLPCTYTEAVTYLETLNLMPSSDLQIVMGEGISQWLGWEEARKQWSAREEF